MFLIILQTSVFQNYAANKAANFLSKELETNITLSKFRINFLLNPVISELKVEDKKGNTLLYSDKIEIDLKRIDFSGKKVLIRNVILDSADINLCKYKNDSTLNLQFIIDYFSSSDTTTREKKPWILIADDIKINNSDFSLIDQNTQRDEIGIDFNNLDITDIYLNFKNINFNQGVIKTDIKKLAFKDVSGFTLENLESKALFSDKKLKLDDLKIKTNQSNLDLQLMFDYDDLSSYSNFIEKVNITADLNKSSLDLKDLVYFVPSLYGMNDKVELSGKVNGTVEKLSLKDFYLSYADNTKLHGDIRLTGLPNIDETFIRFKIKDMQSNYKDLSTLNLPSKDKPKFLKIPEEISNLENVNISGEFTGFINNFVADLDIKSNVGNVKTNLTLTNNSKASDISYKGNLTAQNFDLGKIIDNENFNNITFNGNVSGKGINIDNADLVFNGKIDNVRFNNVDFKNVNINAKLFKKLFEGKVDIDNKFAKLDFLGKIDLNDSIPDLDFVSNIENIELSELNLLPREDSSSISTKIKSKIYGTNLDNLVGNINLLDTRFAYKNRKVAIDSFNIVSSELALNNKQLVLDNDYFNINLQGDYHYKNFPIYYKQIVDQYVSALNKDTIQKNYPIEDNFSFNFDLKNIQPLVNILNPKIFIAPNTTIKGIYHSQNQDINLEANSKLVQVAGFSLFDLGLETKRIDDKLNVNLVSKHIIPSSKTKTVDTSLYIIENFNTNIFLADNIIDYSIKWIDIIGESEKGDINGKLNLTNYPDLKINFSENSSFTFHDTTWNFIRNNEIDIKEKLISVSNFGFKNNKQSLVLNGIISERPEDEIALELDNFDLSIIDFITIPNKMDFDGKISGNATVAQALKSPELNTDFYLSDFGFNKEKLGSAKILSEWDNIKKSLNIDCQIVYKGNFSTYYPIKIIGNILPESKTNNLNLKIDMDNFNIATIEPFTEGIFSRVRGLASGNINVTGPFSKPETYGKINLMRSEFLVDFLRTSYSFTGDVNLSPTRIWFEDIILTDSIGKTGTASGSIYHNHFADLTTDITIIARNLSALNTEYTPDQMFYGQAFVTGIVDITGPFDNLNMDINIRTEQGTDVNIPLNSSTSLDNNDFIIYRNKDSKDSTYNQFIFNESSGLNLSLDLEATPVANIGIVLPNQLGDIQVVGQGNIAIGVNSKGGYSMHGLYTMDEGVFNFNFENILKRSFNIEKGSSIVFNGSPEDADINLSAIYKLRTSVTSLPGMAEYGDIRIPVECILSLTNNLYNPDIKFSINLPDVDNDIRQKVFSVIDTSSAISMNQQMISLLVLNSFSSNSGIMLSESGILSSTEVFTNQINNWLSQISNDFDIGVKYRPGSDISSQELELVLSTQLFDNRIIINGSFGNSYSAATQTNRFIGDMEVEMKITPDGRLRGKVFNRTNTTLNYITEQSPYTQGIGIFYRREFDSFKEFGKKRNR